MTDEEAMAIALEEADLASEAGEVPVGVVLVDAEGTVVGRNHNRREEFGDATAHAEILVLSERSREIGSWRLNGHTMFVTLEPCPMCAMAAVHARLDRVVYGTADLKGGGVWSLYNIPQDERLNHRIDVTAGVLESESRDRLEAFFSSRRSAD